MLTRTSRISALTLALLAGWAVSISAAGALARADAPVPDKAGPGAARPEVDLPIRGITLYRSGVGYFERSGMVDGNSEVTLRFNTEQINDILKSMILLDLGGGSIESVSYGSKEPLARRLASFGINISANPSIPELFSQIRGAPVKVYVAGAEISGTVLGIEQRSTAPTKDVPAVQLPHLNLVTSTGVRSIAITDISSFEILDKELAGELNKALAALAEYRADRTKTVDLRFSGSGSRQVVVGYVHEMPVWKTSYRLNLDQGETSPKKSGEKTKGMVALQGWAIVENTTDQDWNRVKLSLVSGRPVSFQMDLYEPLFTFRPMVAVPTVPGVMPRAYGGGMDLAADEAAKAESLRYRRGNRFETEKSLQDGVASHSGGAYDAMKKDFNQDGRVTEQDLLEYQRTRSQVSAGDMVDYAAHAQAQGAEIGEVFQYQLDAPVSIERQRSAMIPILSANVTGRRVSIFNPSDGAQHPMRGVELINESGLQLLPGPIAVFDGAAYAGDAQIGQVSKGDKRLLAYSVDLDVNVVTKHDSDSQLRRIRIVDGQFEQTFLNRDSTTYAFDNKDAKRGRSILVETQKMNGWDLKRPDKPLEETQTLMRFPLDVEAGKLGTLTVTFERTTNQSIAVTSWDMPTVLAFHKDGKLSDRVLDAFKQVASKQAAQNETERTIKDLNTKMKEISDDQGRIRENMGRIDHSSQLYSKYMTKMTEQEGQLEDLREKRTKAEQTLDTERKDLNEFVRNLNVGD